VRGVGRRRAAFAPVVLLLAVGLTTKVVLLSISTPGDDEAAHLWGATWPAVVERSFLASADLIAFGMLVAVLETLVQQRPVPRLEARGPGLVVAGLSLFAASALAHRFAGLDDRLFDTGAAAASALVVLHAVLPRTNRPRAVMRLFDARPLVYMGDISYSFYLWHMPLLYLVREHGLLQPGALGVLLNVAMLAPVTIAAAAVTYRWVEQPAMRRRERRPQAAHALDKHEASIGPYALRPSG